MKRLLSTRNLSSLARLAASNVLLAFDYDGTLAPIVADRDLAGMRQHTLELFEQVCELYPCAVISGRGKSDVAARLGAARVLSVIGNHGLEPGPDLAQFAAMFARVRPLLEAELVGCQGVEIEDKLYSLAVHYRASRRKREARTAIHEAVSRLPVIVRLVAGKLVLNVVPEVAANKGTALLDLRQRAGADTAFFIGDDVTDEDVFLLDDPERLFTVRVGRSKTSVAKYFLRDQREMDVLLHTFVGLRAKPPPLPALLQQV